MKKIKKKNQPGKSYLMKLKREAQKYYQVNKIKCVLLILN